MRPVPDWPQAGVTFQDLYPLLAEATAFASVIDGLVATGEALGKVDAVLGIEARGFIFGAPVAVRLGAGFVVARKSGKLPGEVLSTSYALEYGEATIEIQADALSQGDRVLLIDDVLATGGTLEAAARLVDDAGATVVGCIAVIELAALGGRARLADVPLSALAVF